MQREGLADDHDLADLEAVLRRELPASRLDPRFEEALIRHIFIDPKMPAGGIGVLDELEVQEAIAYAIGAYIETQARAIAAATPEDDEQLVDDVLEELAGSQVEPDPEEMLAAAEDLLGEPAELPESMKPARKAELGEVE